jgi:hypothetical protein
MEYNRFWVGDSPLTYSSNFLLLWNMKIHYLSCKNQKPVPNLIHVNLVQNLTSCFFNNVYKFLTEDSHSVVVDTIHLIPET